MTNVFFQFPVSFWIQISSSIFPWPLPPSALGLTWLNLSSVPIPGVRCHWLQHHQSWLDASRDSPGLYSLHPLRTGKRKDHCDNYFKKKIKIKKRPESCSPKWLLVTFSGRIPMTSLNFSILYLTSGGCLARVWLIWCCCGAPLTVDLSVFCCHYRRCYYYSW